MDMEKDPILRLNPIGYEPKVKARGYHPTKGLGLTLLCTSGKIKIKVMRQSIYQPTNKL